MRRIEVLNDDEGQTAVGGAIPEELFQGLKPAGRATDADNRDSACVASRYGRDFLAEWGRCFAFP